MAYFLKYMQPPAGTWSARDDEQNFADNPDQIIPAFRGLIGTFFERPFNCASLEACSSGEGIVSST